ncbi:Protein MAIN-LIKE 1 [Glycine soja]
MTYAQPGPIDGSLLRLQDNHVSNQVWEDQERMIRPRYNSIWAFTNLDRIDNRVKNLITLAGFDHVINVRKVDINQHLVSALIERWRTETHTFHFPHGEATITLQDVVLQLDLKIDGLPQLLVDANDVVIALHARAHIMMLIGGYLMPDRVHFMMSTKFSTSRLLIIYASILFQVLSTSNVFYGPSQMFATTFNTPPSAYNLPPLTSCYRPSLLTQMRDMGHEDKEDDDDDNNNNDDDDDGDDHVLQQQ